MQQTLTNLQDVPGVIGSFVLSREGGLLGRAMPSYVPDDIYPDLGRRLSTAFATMDASFGSYEDVLLKFDEHWLLCRRMPQGYLGIISSPTVNYPALRMASNMAISKLEGSLAEKPATPEAPAVAVAPALAPTPAPAPAPTPAPASAPAAAVPAAKPGLVRRMWRGQPVD